MSRKIVAIGGGKNGRIKEGRQEPYETEIFDKEIIRLTQKKNPHFLFIGHAMTEPMMEAGYYETMKKIYGEMYQCPCRQITRQDLLEDTKKVKANIAWADIIYEGGGNTKAMVELWKETGFDLLLEKAWREGKVLCGVSAGANCWFQSCSSDSLRIEKQDENAPMIIVDGLGFINAFFTPHCDEGEGKNGRLEHMKASLKEHQLIGIGMSNCAAIEIVDNQFRLLTAPAQHYGINAYGIKAYWKGNQYITEKIKQSDAWLSLTDLLSTEK